MIETLRQCSSAARSYAARLLDATRPRLSTFDAGAVSALIGVSLPTPARIVARTPLATQRTLASREAANMRRHCGATRL